MIEPEATFTIRLFPDRTQTHVDAAGGDPMQLLERAIEALRDQQRDLRHCPYHQANEGGDRS